MIQEQKWRKQTNYLAVRNKKWKQYTYIGEIENKQKMNRFVCDI